MESMKTPEEQEDELQNHVIDELEEASLGNFHIENKSTQMKDQKQQSMRERFEERFGSGDLSGDFPSKAILSFIEDLLAERDREVVEVCEKEKKIIELPDASSDWTPQDRENMGYNFALTDLQEYIKNRK